MDKTVAIARDFSLYPGPRYADDGPYSGEIFRNTVLKPELEKAIASNGILTVILDEVAGYGSSFLEEAFGGLIRIGFKKTQLDRHLRVVAKTNRFQHHVLSVQKYISDAARIAAQ